LAKYKNPTAVWQWGREIRVIPLEPNCHATQQQRARQQLQIQIAIHANRSSAVRCPSQFVFCCSQRPGSAKVAAEKTAELMNVQIAVLCDAATDYGGKLNLLGTFDTIVTQQLPAVHPQCSVALRIVFSRVEEGQHKVKMNFVDEDGRPVMRSIDMPVEVALPTEVNFVARNFVINIQQLKFDKPGQYAIDIAIDGRQEASIPLHVKQMPPAQD